MTEFRYKVAAVAIMKHEERYVAEWVQFHIAMGIDHFYIYDNSDTPEGMQAVLKNYIFKDIVTLIHMPGPKKMFEAYNHAIKNYKDDCKYMAIIDADEFIINSDIRPLDMVIDDIVHASPYQVGGVGINWRIYGTSNHTTRPEGLVIENYLWRGVTPRDDHVKTIVNPRAVSRYDNPHYPHYNPGYCCVSEGGEQIFGPFHKLTNVERVWNVLRINHYYYKSEEDVIFRIEKKKADRNIDEAEEAALVEAMLNKKDEVNQIYDPIALHWLDKVKEGLAEMEGKE